MRTDVAARFQVRCWQGYGDYWDGNNGFICRAMYETTGLRTESIWSVIGKLCRIAKHLSPLKAYLLELNP